MGGGKGAPSQPSPAQQSAVNLDTAIAQSYLNQFNQTSPFGTVTYTPTGETMTVGTGKNARDLQKYSQNITLDPSQQRQLDLKNEMSEGALGVGNQMIGNIGEQIQKPFDMSGLPNLTNDYSADRQRIEDTLYGRQATRLDDRFGRQEDQLKTQLTNQGIQQGSEAWTNAMKDFNYGRNDAYQGALSSAVAMGGQEQANLDSMSRGARQQGFQESSYLRSLPTNELATLLGFSGGVQMPQFSAPPQTGVANTTLQARPGTDYSTANSIFGALGNIGAGYAGSTAGSAALTALFSDRRVKENVKKVGKLDNGLNVYSYNYTWDKTPRIGLMADEVEKTNPEAVTEIGGIKAVNYGEAVQ